MIFNADGLTCMNNPNVDQRGELSIGAGGQVIVPRASFNCNGRVTDIAVSMRWGGRRSGNLPLFQVWHPTSLTSNTYNKTGEIQLPVGMQRGRNRQGTNYFYARMSLSSSSQIEFQSGDVIGYYQPSNSRRRIWSIETRGYTSYSKTATSPLTTLLDISNADIESNSQPLIEVMFGKVTKLRITICSYNPSYVHGKLHYVLSLFIVESNFKSMNCMHSYVGIAT